MSKRIGNYIIHLKEVIGRGSYGEVCRGEEEMSKQPCAIKIIQKERSKQQNR